MISLLAHALGESDGVVTLTAGTLERGMVLACGGEKCLVDQVFTPTQAKVLRGAEGTRAMEHDAGDLVQLVAPAGYVDRGRPEVKVLYDKRIEFCPTCGKVI